MPSCPLCATDFPALPADTACKRCVALQVLGADPEHPNYVQTQGWKQCLHCGISAPHLSTASNVSKTVCLSQVCIAWATPSTDGGESATLPSGVSSASEQRILALQTRLKRFPPSTMTLTAAAFKPRSISGSSAEKMVTVAYTVCRSSSKTSDPSIGGQAVPKARSVLMPGMTCYDRRDVLALIFMIDLLAEFLETINVEWVKSSPEKLILSDVSLRFYGNRLLEKGTSTLSLGEFFDYYNHPIRREIWLSKMIPLWKHVKGPILHLEINVNVTAVKARAAELDSDDEDVSTSSLKRKKKGISSTPKRICSNSARLTSHFSPMTTAGFLQGQLDIQEQLPIQLIKVKCSAEAVDGNVTFTTVDEIVTGFIGKKEIARGAMKQVHQLNLSGVSYVAKSFFRVEETGPDNSAGALENQVELKLELRRISQGQWFLNKFHERAKITGVTSIYQDLHFVNAYLGTEVDPTEIAGQKDDGTTLTPWAWIVEKRRAMSVTKWSGTLAHPNHRGDLVGATICAFVHFAYICSQRSIVFADIQGTQAQISPGIEGLVLFDIMTHTVTGGSGVGDHGIEGIQIFLDDHSCGPVCRKLKLGSLTTEEPPSPPRQESESEPTEDRAGDDN